MRYSKATIYRIWTFLLGPSCDNPLYKKADSNASVCVVFLPSWTWPEHKRRQTMTGQKATHGLQLSLGLIHFSTNKILAHQTYFKAAIPDECKSNIHSTFRSVLVIFTFICILDTVYGTTLKIWYFSFKKQHFTWSPPFVAFINSTQIFNKWCNVVVSRYKCFLMYLSS